MSLSALIALSKKIDEEYKAKFDGRVPISRKIVGYQKGHWVTEYTFRTQGGHSIETRLEQDARSIAHQKAYPND